MTEISRGPVLKPEACQPPDLEQHRCRKRNEKPAADTRDHSRLLGLLSGFVTRPMPGLEVPPVESPVESFARLVLFHLASKSALQRMMTAAVMAHWVSLHPDHLCPSSVRERVLECLGETLYFDEMASSFTRLQQDARDFIALLRHFQIPLGSEFPANVVLTVDQVMELVTTVFQGLVQDVRVKPKVLESLEEKRRCLLRTAQQMQKDQLLLTTRVQSLLSMFLVRLDQLPEKLNPVIRPLMESIRREESVLLQEESADSLVHLMSSCVTRNPCPNGKIMRNLLMYLCSDSNVATPAMAQGVLSEDISSDHLPIILFIEKSTLQERKKQTSAERAPVRRSGSVSGGRKGSLQASQSVESVDDYNGADDENVQRQNEVQRKGAAQVLLVATKHFGASLPNQLPSLWEATMDPLLQRANMVFSGGGTHNGEPVAEEQELTTSLQALEVIGPHLHSGLYSKLEATLPPLCAALDHNSPVVRHLVSRCFGMMARIRTEPTMAVIVDKVLAKLGASDDDIQRRGAIEAIACVIEGLSLGVVPYLVFLVVPVLGRMSDQDEAVRLMATHCFAALVRLMPLDSGVIDKAGEPLSADLCERRASERHFLEQLMDARHADNYELCALLLSVVSAAPTSDTQRPATEAITTATDSADYSYRRITLDPVSATTGAWGSDVTSEAAYIPDADDRKLQWARRNRSQQSSEHAFFIVLSGTTAIRRIGGTNFGHATTSYRGYHDSD
ncbi:hypothetical protein MRX96_000112 [Rhipicephalus microplus]